MFLNEINEIKNSINSNLGLKDCISNINELKGSINNVNSLKDSVDNINNLKKSINTINGLKNINTIKGAIKSINSYSDNLSSLQVFISEFEENGISDDFDSQAPIFFSVGEFFPYKGQGFNQYANCSEVKTVSTIYYENLIEKLTTKFLTDRDAKTYLELKWAISQLNSILLNSKSRLKYLIYLIKCELTSKESVDSNRKFDKFIQRNYSRSNHDDEDANIYIFRPNFGTYANIINRNYKYSHLIYHEKNCKRNYYRRTA